MSYGRCPECGGPGFPSKSAEGIFGCSYCRTRGPVPAGQVECPECDYPPEHVEHVRIRAEAKRIAGQPEQPMVPPPPAAKKGRSVLERVAIGYGVYMLLNLICAPLGALPFLFVNWEDTTSLAVTLVIGIAVAAVLPIVVAVMVVVRMSRKR